MNPAPSFFKMKLLSNKSSVSMRDDDLGNAEGGSGGRRRGGLGGGGR